MRAALAGLALGALVGWVTRERPAADVDAKHMRLYAHRDMNDHIPGAN